MARVFDIDHSQMVFDVPESYEREMGK